MDQTIGSYLRACRKMAGKTQQEIATTLKKRQATISCWESGKYRPFANELDQVAEAYQADVAELRNIYNHHLKGSRFGNILPTLKVICASGLEKITFEELSRILTVEKGVGMQLTAEQVENLIGLEREQTPE